MGVSMAWNEAPMPPRIVWRTAAVSTSMLIVVMAARSDASDTTRANARRETTTETP